jgi:hypothetical protein
MAWLDCTDLPVATAVLADALGVEQSALCAAFIAYDEGVFDDTSQDPLVRMPREVSARLDRDIASVGFEGSIYFHATRVLDPNCFGREGILPLGMMLEHIWGMLFDLVSDVCSAADWSSFRQWWNEGGDGPDGGLYRSKVNSQLAQGPYGILVQEMFFRRGEVNISNFLECPEIVQDISRCFEAHRGVDLQSRFCEASTPVVVSFRGPYTGVGSVEAAFWYVYNQVRDGSMSNNSDCCFDGWGSPVEVEQIISIVEVSEP